MVAKRAPAAIVEPSLETATPLPVLSLASPSVAVSLAAWVPVAQPPPGLRNTYTAPWPEGAPPTIVEPSPEIAAEKPRRSPAPPGVAVSLAVSVVSAQPPTGSTNAYTPPWSLL